MHPEAQALQPETHPTARSADELFAEAVAIMARLRGPDGCPWDREQTPRTIRKYTLEETYEVLDAIERDDSANLCEELGDLLLQVLFYAQMAAEADQFTIAEVIEGLNRKLIRRHPHVFGHEASAAAGNAAKLDQTDTDIGSEQVLHNWNAIKRFEQKAKVEDKVHPSRLAGVLRSQPALLEAAKLGSAAARCGFDWPEATGLIDKIREEADEVEAEIRSGKPASRGLQLEVGDLLFVTANLARHLGVEPEIALRDANAKFRSRFTAMEAAEQSDGGGSLEQRSLDDLEELWQQAKQLEKADAAAGRNGSHGD
jgi:ATP diphosphatase